MCQTLEASRFRFKSQLCLFLSLSSCINYLSSHTPEPTTVGAPHWVVMSIFNRSLQMVKIRLPMREMWARPLGWEEPLGNGTHASVLVWEHSPWAEAWGLQSMGPQELPNMTELLTTSILNDIIFARACDCVWPIHAQLIIVIIIIILSDEPWCFTAKPDNESLPC